MGAFGRAAFFYKICDSEDCIGGYKKDLTIFCDEKVTLDDIVFVDDQPSSHQVFEQQYNTIRIIRRMFFERTDDWLKILIPFLAHLAHVPNVNRTIRSLVKDWSHENVVLMNCR